MLITKMSPITGKDNTMEINTTQDRIDAYERGEGLIQEIFPDLNTDEREFIMTGITSGDWDDLFEYAED